MREAEAAHRQADRAQQRPMRQGAERQHHPERRHRRQLRLEEAVAGPGLHRLRQIGRRHAAHRVGHAAAGQHEPIIRPLLVAALREAVLQQGRVEQAARVVAGERAAGAVRAALARRHAEHQQRRLARTPGRDGGVVPGGFRGRFACRSATSRGQSGQSRPGSAGSAAAAAADVPSRARYSGSSRFSRKGSAGVARGGGAAAAAARSAGRCSAIRGRGSTCRRVMCSASSARSMKLSACRRNSSAIIAGWVRMVETTVTRSPRRCTASTSRRRSPSPENSTTWSRCGGEVEHVHRHLDVHAALHPAAAGGVRELLRRLGDDGVAVVAEPVHERPQRRILVGLQQRGVVVGANQVALLAEVGEQVLVVHVEPQGAGCGVEVGPVDEDGEAFAAVVGHGAGLRNAVHCAVSTYDREVLIIRERKNTALVAIGSNLVARGRPHPARDLPQSRDGPRPTAGVARGEAVALVPDDPRSSPARCAPLRQWDGPPRSGGEAPAIPRDLLAMLHADRGRGRPHPALPERAPDPRSRPDRPRRPAARQRRRRSCRTRAPIFAVSSCNPWRMRGQAGGTRCSGAPSRSCSRRCPTRTRPSRFRSDGGLRSMLRRTLTPCNTSGRWLCPWFPAIGATRIAPQF